MELEHPIGHKGRDSLPPTAASHCAGLDIAADAGRDSTSRPAWHGAAQVARDLS